MASTQRHHIASRDLAKNSDVLRELSKRGLFDVEAPQNKVDLPSTRAEAAKQGSSPHNGRPLSSYEDGIRDRLDKLMDKPDYKKMLDGDMDAGRRLMDDVKKLQDAVREGLESGKLLTNRLLDDVKKGIPDANDANKKWFDSLDDAAKKALEEAPSSNLGKLLGGLSKLGPAFDGIARILDGALKLAGREGFMEEDLGLRYNDIESIQGAMGDDIKDPRSLTRAMENGYSQDSLRELAKSGKLNDFLDKTKGEYIPTFDPMNTELRHYGPTPDPRGVNSSGSANNQQYDRDHQGGNGNNGGVNNGNNGGSTSSQGNPNASPTSGGNFTKSMVDKETGNTVTNGFGGPKPILLDIAGTGIAITELTSSNRFMDAEGTGLLHRTAWAGAGTGVLFYDPNNEGAIVRNDQYIFTEWDPTARGDLEALRNVFDSNGDGVFTSADAKFALFKIEVTNADGTTSVMTMAAAGITSINLKADLTDVRYEDGSAITGQTTFTRANGTTGTVANTTLAAESAGYAMTKVVSTDGSGNRVVTNTAYAADGSIAEVVRSVTSPTGNSVVTSFEVNGDGSLRAAFGGHAAAWRLAA
jgi:A nuclease family of the HNH/ENDO VII superfamily with conserved AHH